MSTVAVVIPCFSEARWDDILRAVDSAAAQTVPVELVVVVDHNDTLLHRLRRELGDRARVVPNRYARGASGGRNTGALVSESELVAFLDDDEVAEPTWIEELLRAHHEAPFATGVGGAIEARWPVGAPRWFPEQFSWVVGGSMPRPSLDVRNVWGANLLVRRSRLLAVGGFSADLGKVGDASQPEDTELCLRLNAHTGPGARWRFTPHAVVWHEVPPERQTFGFFLRRCHLEGAGKRHMAALPTAGDDVLAEETAFVRTVLVNGVARNLAAALRGDVLGGLARAGAILAGIAAAGVGYLTARPVTRRTAAVAPVSGAPGTGTAAVGDVPGPRAGRP
ncbi:glycosyltransferase family 2 protein [Geodermatophilus marinus]|uniref:glycosyltransferase family 2 protein n=1 Tax=Geodermatophilus sp. LHW52908 TaxID=2303986 RepID=UPI000E3D73FF|nr:glycosyltransferase [Geodermatophilus sp. LHW52908]RFU22383.1 glycosyltransferase family 2 protein [Geodermatophilus sp. LHW52908]